MEYKSKIKFLKSLLFFYIILIILISFLAGGMLYFGTLPNQEKGGNNSSLGLNFEIYIINNLTTLTSIEKYFKESNNIWNKYNISISVKKIYNNNLNLSNQEKEFLYEAFSYNNSSESCSEDYMPLIGRITNNSNELKIIFIDRASSHIAGRGCLCNCSFVIVDIDKFLIDFTGLNLAHEIGHLMGLEDISLGRQNLMNHHIFLKSFKSHFLNQEQINIIQNNSLFNKKI